MAKNPIKYTLTESIPSASQYDAIKTFEQQTHSIDSTLLADMGAILVKHGMHIDYGAALLHRHEAWQPGNVMIHTSPNLDMDICKMERLQATDVPCAWSLNFHDQFQAFEWCRDISTITPSKYFLEELGLFLSTHGVSQTIALSRISRFGKGCTDLWVEYALPGGNGTVATRCYNDEDKELFQWRIATEWTFLDLGGTIQYKITRACVKPPEGGGHVIKSG